MCGLGWASKSVCKIMLPTAARSTFLKKCDTKSELEHENHERGVLQLAFLMQIRTKVRPASFCWPLARHWLVFFENHKIDPLMVLERPGGMRGGAGRRFEEG